MKEIILGALGMLTVAAVCAAVTYSCVNTNATYRGLAETCIQSGGSWLPNTANGNGGGTCVAGRGR